MICKNCKAKLGCGCQVRKASDGTSCCSNCISQYQAGLNTIKVAEEPNSPQKVNVTYVGPGKQIK